MMTIKDVTKKIIDLQYSIDKCPSKTKYNCHCKYCSDDKIRINTYEEVLKYNNKKNKK